MKVAVDLMAVKWKSGFYGKKCAILPKQCAASLIYDGIFCLRNRHSQTKILSIDTKEKPRELLKNGRQAVKSGAATVKILVQL